jgi:hypothetical protein
MKKARLHFSPTTPTQSIPPQPSTPQEQRPQSEPANLRISHRDLEHSQYHNGHRAAASKFAELL